MNNSFQQLMNMASQMKKMSNYQRAMTPEQQKVVNEINGKSEQEKAQMIADELNKKGITKEQFAMIVQMSRY